MIVGYERVSTEEQNLERQHEALTKLNVEKIYSEKISGKNTDRPQLKAMLEFVREGDTLIVESYSRLARSTRDLLEIVEELERKGVSFISLKENIDTTTPHGRLMLTIFAGLSQFERECTLQRQREGIEIAKKQGKYTGRKKIDRPENWDLIISSYKAGNITAKYAQQQLGLKPATFFRMLKESSAAS